MASFDFNGKPISNLFLRVDHITPEYNCSAYGNNLKGIWVYIGNDGHFFPCDSYSICDPEIAREDGRSQVVALAKELGEMKFADRNELFGNYTVPDILNHRSYEQIVEMLKDWKKEKETIHVRDEVVQKLDSRLKFVVTEVHDGNGDTYISGVSKDGKVYPGHNIKNYKKTGLHVDDLDSYLEV